MSKNKKDIRYYLCVSGKFSNFQVNKVYQASASAEYLNGTPTDFRIKDEDGDLYTIDFERFPSQRRIFTEVHTDGSIK